MGFFSAITGIGKALGLASSAKSVFDMFTGASEAREDDFNAQQIALSREQMDFQREQAQLSRDWQERLTRNRHTYEIDDLRRAGLNPILSAHTGASIPSSIVPSGAQPTHQQQPSSTVSSESQKTMTALATAKLAAEVELLESQAEKTRSEAGLASQQTLTEPWMRDKIQQESNKIYWESGLISRQLNFFDERTRAEISELYERAALHRVDQLKSVADAHVASQRVQLLIEETKLTHQHLLDLLARYPGLLVEKEIDESEYGSIIRYIDRAIPSVSTALGAAGTVALFKKLNSIGSKSGVSRDWNRGFDSGSRQPYPFTH